MSLSAPRARLILLLFLSLGLAGPASVASPPTLTEAQALFDERRYAEAQPLFETLRQTDPKNTQVLLHLGKLAAKRGERELAVDYLKQAVEIAPNNAELQFEYGAASCLYAGSLGMSFKALGAVRRGRDAMEKAVEMEPRNLIFRQGLLEFYSGAPALVGGGMKKAHAQADAIAAIDLDQGHFARANLYRVEGNLSAALTAFGAVLERAPDNYFALYQFGRCAAESGEQLERGLQVLRRCLELPAPDQAAPPAYAWWRIGQIQIHQGNIAAARTSLAKAQTLAPHETRIADEIAALPAPTR